MGQNDPTAGGQEIAKRTKRKLTKNELRALRGALTRATNKYASGGGLRRREIAPPVTLAGEKQMTLGEDRVRTKFNPSAETLVDQIKQKTAKLIDLCEDLKLLAQRTGGQSEMIRLCAEAQTRYEDAAHWAVKAATYGK